MGIKAATPDDENKKEIELLFKKLSYNLDVLSNLSFTPKGIFETTKIVPNVASINLEEKTPLSFSDRHAKAPQELFSQSKVQLEVFWDCFRRYLIFLRSLRKNLQLKKIERQEEPSREISEPEIKKRRRRNSSRNWNSRVKPSTSITFNKRVSPTIKRKLRRRVNSLSNSPNHLNSLIIFR